jgi:hypothetical protein
MQHQFGLHTGRAERRLAEPSECPIGYVSPSAIFFDANGKRVTALTLAVGGHSFAASVAAWTLIQDERITAPARP